MTIGTRPRRSIALMLGAIALCSIAVGCGAGAPPYAECVDSADCPEPSDGCYHLLYSRSDGSEADGTMCSRECAADADCPDDGACLALEGDGARRFFCAARCTVSSECYAGLACTRVEGAERTMEICLPE